MSTLLLNMSYLELSSKPPKELLKAFPKPKQPLKTNYLRRKEI